jgi:hypothetical protein
MEELQILLVMLPDKETLAMIIQWKISNEYSSH